MREIKPREYRTYCYHCGTELVPVQEFGFDPFTGELKYEFDCKNHSRKNGIGLYLTVQEFEKAKRVNRELE